MPEKDARQMTPGEHRARAKEALAYAEAHEANSSKDDPYAPDWHRNMLLTSIAHSQAAMAMDAAPGGIVDPFEVK